jgi:hypothetical protein
MIREDHMATVKTRQVTGKMKFQCTVSTFKVDDTLSGILSLIGDIVITRTINGSPYFNDSNDVGLYKKVAV